MRRSSYQPLKDADFIAWAENIDSECTKNAVNWNLRTTDVSRLNTLTASAVKTYETNMNSELKNRLTGTEKRAAFAELKRFLSGFINTLEGNLDVPDTDIGAMQLRPRRRRAAMPLPPPADAPHVTVRAGQHGRITLFVAVPQLGHATAHLARPEYYGIAVRYRMEGDTEWKIQLSTRLRITLVFDDSDCGRHITLSAAWISPRLQFGPWSDSVDAIVN